MRDILEAVAFEAGALGVDAAVIDEPAPTIDDTVFVLIPHEYFATVPSRDWPSEQQLSRTIALTVEHPGTPWFETSAQQARRCGAIVDINRDAAAELARRGCRATHFQIGYTEAWDQWTGEPDSQRDVDILYLGSTDPGRDAALANYGAHWWRYRTRILVPGHEPKTEESNHYYLGKRKFRLLADSQVTLNLHRLETSSLEWVRVIEAMCNGAVVVSDHSTDDDPLVPGVHYLSGSRENLGRYAGLLIEQPDRAEALRQRAYEFIRERLPMRRAVEMLLEEGAALLSARQPVPRIADIPQIVPYEPPTFGWPTEPTQLDFIGSSLRRIEGRLRRLEVAATRERLGLPAAGSAILDEYVTPAYEVVSPRCSVVIPLHNYEREVIETLDSVAASTGIEFDVLIQDDCSTDGSLSAVRRYLETHPALPAKLRRAQVNQGLSATRNDLLAAARSNYVFTLDADNGVFPTGLARLADELDADPEATFAYSIIAGRRSGQYVRLISERAWQPSLLRLGNYIDAMAMLRRDRILDLGGYDTSMFGWEDFHLWARVAEHGGHGAFVPEILSWYRLSEHSMISETHIDLVALWSKIRAAAPTLMSDDR